jgi:hypothetical protein
MALPLEGTFRYAFTVPDGPGTVTRRMVGTLIDDVNPANPRRLLGHAPVLESVLEQREPWQLYARLTISARDRKNAKVPEASFVVERGLITVLSGGDVLSIARSSCGSLGLSIVRDGQLIAAVGAATHVPLGQGLTVHTPHDLIAQAESVFRTRDPSYEMSELPVQFALGSEFKILQRGRGARLGPYEIHVLRGFRLGLPGSNECVSIERRGVSPDTAAQTSAELLEREGLQFPPERS